MMERSSDRDIHCSQPNLTGGGKTQFHISRQMRFQLNLMRALFAANSRSRSNAGLQQQLESECCESASLYFMPSSCIIFSLAMQLLVLFLPRPQNTATVLRRQPLSPQIVSV